MRDADFGRLPLGLFMYCRMGGDTNAMPPCGESMPLGVDVAGRSEAVGVRLFSWEVDEFENSS
jgi:hypothetical protein